MLESQRSQWKHWRKAVNARTLGSRSRRIRWASRVIAILSFSVVAAAGAIVIDGMVDESEPTDVAIVLGNKVYPSGKPSPALTARLSEALAGFQAKRYPRIFVSGGWGKEGHDEAAVMRDWLIERGVPAGAIATDSLGNNTWLTAQHAKTYMEEHGLASATVVSQYFHITRCKYLCRRAGIEDVKGCSPWHFAFKDILSIPREVVALFAYWAGIKGDDQP